jgi:hypothetical protein
MINLQGLTKRYGGQTAVDQANHVTRREHLQARLNVWHRQTRRVSNLAGGHP